MTTQELLDAIDVELVTLVESPNDAIDYREGDVEVKRSQKVTNLLKIKAQLLGNPDAEITTMAFDFCISQFGENLTEYED